ncbi:MAG: Fic family protein [Bacteroidales bacterium]|nr:Fic family protein [Bacteroidales bacterium]
MNGLKTSNNKIKTLAEIIGEMNIIHPFREGNGRSIRTFIQLLAKAQNIVID